MADTPTERLRLVLRGLAGGKDPARLLSEVLMGALAATGAREGLVLHTAGATPTVVATTGDAGAALTEAAHAAATTDRMVRRRDPSSAAVAAAEPLRVGGRVVGALAVVGTMDRLDPSPLPLWGDLGGLVLARRPEAGDALAPEVLDSLSAVGTDLDSYAMLSRVFDACGALFGATSGFCALFDDGAVRIGHYRGLDHDRLVQASRHPAFRELLTSTALRVDGADNPVVGQLARLGELAVGVPLMADGRRMGQLVLLLPSAPDGPRQALLASFGRHAGQCLRSAELFRRLGDHEEQLGAMVHSMANPVVVVDEAGRLVEVNGAAAELFRLAQSFESELPVTGRLGHRELEELLVGGDDGALEVVLGAEEPRVYRASVRRVRSGDGRPMGRILVLDDLTSERQVDALKADFVAVIGHELRTPLTVMKGYLHTLTRRWQTLADDKRAQALEALQSNVLRLERLIEDLLFISAIEQRRCTLDLAVHDLGSLLEARAGDRVVLRRPRRPIELELDEAKVGQVVHHLLDNALKYSEGPVTLELVDRGDVVEISVTDDGPGIFSGDIPHLFERFRQLDGSSTRTHGGVGIGLYLCKRIVEAMGGRIWCESRLGVGSTFTFTLPRDGTASTAPRRQQVGVTLS